jgi:hypothetical protein
MSEGFRLPWRPTLGCVAAERLVGARNRDAVRPTLERTLNEAERCRGDLHCRSGEGVQPADLAVGSEPAPAPLQLLDAVTGDLEQVWWAVDDKDMDVTAHGLEPQLGRGDCGWHGASAPLATGHRRLVRRRSRGGHPGRGVRGGVLLELVELEPAAEVAVVPVWLAAMPAPRPRKSTALSMPTTTRDQAAGRRRTDRRVPTRRGPRADGGLWSITIPLRALIG